MSGSGGSAAFTYSANSSAFIAWVSAFGSGGASPTVRRYFLAANATSSLGTSAARRTRWPLTRVPLVLPRSRISNEAVGLDQHAVLLGDALVIDLQIAVLLAADDRDVVRQLNRFATVGWDQSGLVHAIKLPARPALRNVLHWP